MADAFLLNGIWSCLEIDFTGLELADELETVDGFRLIRADDAEADGFQVLRFEAACTGFSTSFFDLRRKGLFEKKPDLFFCRDFSGEVGAIPGNSTPLIGADFVGEFFPDIGSALVKLLGLEYSL